MKDVSITYGVKGSNDKAVDEFENDIGEVMAKWGLIVVGRDNDVDAGTRGIEYGVP